MALLASLLLHAPACAAVDATGSWALTVEVFTAIMDARLDLTQTGTQLSVTYAIESLPPSGPYVGTIDPATGVFSVSIPGECFGDQIAGTVAADGVSMGGFWNATSRVMLGCTGFSFPFTGVRMGCGNGVVSGDELCDDGNTTGGDCCSVDCQVAASDGTACTDGDVCTTGDVCSAGSCEPTGVVTCEPGEVCGASGCEFVCGNGVLDAGETCDDGNLVGGDCCSALCETAAPDGTACTDDDVCTTDDHCSAGACVPGAPLACEPCEVCGAEGCQLPTAPACQPAKAGGQSKLTLASGAKSKLVWSWRSSASVSPDDLGAPHVDTGISLCVIDQSGGGPTLRASVSAPAGGFCGSRRCWQHSVKGDVYRDGAAAADGLVGMKLGVGTVAGTAKFSAKAAGPNLELPGDVLTPPVVVRVVRDDAPSCWEATYSHPRINVTGAFKAVSD